ncbi:hypothetical protein EXIGLDRAFT_725735 [Exidia glandulosa HHB12029]|uniref:FHA domain-containing protein n=1 Tax=Exidia glandulosa HHB12029 TaxID=1314781 RepID=A0A165Q9I1_EXIGL|nr:hypothetical protein EXIGLDRAFT_725735 [Exidia glandulosa HHB12029]
MSISDDDDIQFMGIKPAPQAGGTGSITLTVEPGGVPRTFHKIQTRTVQVGRVAAEHAHRLAGHLSQAAYVCPVMSRQHARLAFSDNGQVTIMDLGSHHGTVIARGDDQLYIQLLPDEKYIVHDNDLVTFGKTVYKAGTAHHPLSVRVNLSAQSIPTAPKSASPGPVRYGLFESDSEDSGSGEDDSPSSSDPDDHESSETPPGNQLGLLSTASCMPMSLPTPVLPPIASFSIPGFWSGANSNHNIEPVTDMPSQHAQQLESQYSIQLSQPPQPYIPQHEPPLAMNNMNLRHEVDELKDELNSRFLALKADIDAVQAHAAAAGTGEWERLRASVKADFPDGIRDRVGDLEQGLKRLNELVGALGDVTALRAELGASHREVDALKAAVEALKTPEQDNSKALDSQLAPPSPSPRKRKRDFDDEPASPSVVKRIRSGAPLVAVGAAAMYLGLCAL